MIEIVRAARSIIPALEVTFLSLRIRVFILETFLPVIGNHRSCGALAYCCGVAYNLVFVNLKFVLRMSKQFEKI